MAEDASNLNDVIKDANVFFSDMGDAGETDMLKLSSLLSDYGSAWTEAGQKREKALSLKKEVEEGRTDLAEYETAIKNVLGSASSEADSAGDAIDGVNEALDSLPVKKEIEIIVNTSVGSMVDAFQNFFPHAKGNWKVPYDNYPVLAHRDERILTASQARAMDEGQTGGGVDVKALSETMVSAIREGMKGVTVDSYINGKRLNDEMSRESMKTIKARRFGG